jgi:tetratricopeptide (TPR) repeat protein
MTRYIPCGCCWLLTILLAGAQTNMPATPVAPSTNETDKIEAEYQALLRLDDAAVADIQSLVKQSQTRQGSDVGMPSDEELQKQVRFKLDSVRKAYESFLKANPGHVRAMIAYGSFLCDTEQEEEGLRWWEKARETDPKNAAVRNNLANHYGHSGEPKRAIEEYEAAIQIAPNEPIYHFNLANALYLFRRDAAEWKQSSEEAAMLQALESFRKARDLEPNNYDYASAYAETFYSLKDPNWQRAIEAWDFCLKLNVTPLQREQIHTHLARIHIRAGNLARAREHLKQIQSDQMQDVRQRLTEIAAHQESLRPPGETASTDSPRAQ